MTWELVKLKELALMYNGGTPDRSNGSYYEGTIPWITSTDLQESEVKLVRFHITDDAVSNSATRIMPEGSILLVTRTGVGKVAIAPFDICISQDFTGIIPDAAKIDTRYLLHYLRQSQSYFAARARGATIQGVTREVVSSLEIPLPPLPVQQRIAAVLDEVDALRQKREEVVNKLYHLKEVLFLQMFGDPATNPFAFPTGTVRDVVSTANYGTSSKAGADGSLPILRMGNITYLGGWNLKDIKYIDIDDGDIDKYTVKSGDILFNRTNSKELVGKMAVYREDDPMAFAGYLVRVRVNELAHPEFLSSFFNTSYMKKRLQDSCKAIVGMANINAQELQNYPIYIPPVALQREFARQLESVRAIELKALDALDQHRLLSASLQARAFSGTLTLRDLEAVL